MGGGGYDFGIALSGSSSATAGIGESRFGDIISGGSALPRWTLPVVFAVGAVVAIVWILRKW